MSAPLEGGKGDRAWSGERAVGRVSREGSPAQSLTLVVSDCSDHDQEAVNSDRLNDANWGYAELMRQIRADKEHTDSMESSHANLSSCAVRGKRGTSNAAAIIKPPARPRGGVLGLRADIRDAVGDMFKEVLRPAAGVEESVEKNDVDDGRGEAIGREEMEEIVARDLIITELHCELEQLNKQMKEEAADHEVCLLPCSVMSHHLLVIMSSCWSPTDRCWSRTQSKS